MIRLAPLALVLAACAGDGVVLSQRDLGSSVDLATGAVLDGGLDAAGPQTEVACGLTTCPGTCCVAAAGPSCVAPGEPCPAGGAFTCDGEEDCAPGATCCGERTGAETAPSSARCTASCATAMCHDSDACGGGVCNMLPAASYLSACEDAGVAPAGIHCGAEHCPAGGAQVCCLKTAPGCESSAAGACDPIQTLACDGPEDCAAGEICCVDRYDGSSDISAQSHCATAAACALILDRRLCQRDADCPSPSRCAREPFGAGVAHCEP